MSVTPTPPWGADEVTMRDLLALNAQTVALLIRLHAERDAARRTASLLGSGMMALREEIAKMYGPDSDNDGTLGDVLALLDDIDRKAYEDEVPAAVPKIPDAKTAGDSTAARHTTDLHEIDGDPGCAPHCVECSAVAGEYVAHPMGT